MKLRFIALLSLTLFVFTQVSLAQWDTNYFDSTWWGPSLSNTLRSPKTGGTTQNTTGTTGGSGYVSPTPSPTPSCPGTSILDLKNIPNTSQVKMVEGGAVSYLGSTEKINFVHVDGVDRKIYYEEAGVTIMPEEVGQITVCGKGYPEYGYIYREKWNKAKGYTTDSPSPAPPPAPEPADLTVPEKATAVNVNAETGEVFNACNGAKLDDAKYDASTNKILVADNPQSSYGTMLSETKGYVNMDLRGINQTCYTWDKNPSPILAPSPILFQDIPADHPMAEALALAVEKGWIKKTKKFYPERKMKMCELAKIIIKMTGIELESPPSKVYPNMVFRDVPVQSPDAPYVYTGLSKDFWTALPKMPMDQFGCKKNVRRGRFAEILASVFALTEKSDFTPKDTTGEWSLEAIQKVHNTGLMGVSENGKFGAKKSLTKGDALTSLSRAFGVE